MALPGCFGKLPAAADFVSRNHGTPAAIALARWLQESIPIAHTRFVGKAELLLREMPTLRFFWRAGGINLVGSMVASRDQSGRLFPFAAFFDAPALDLAKRFPELPERIEPRLRNAEQLARSPHANLGDVYSHVEALASVPYSDTAGLDRVVSGRTLGQLAAGGTDPELPARVLRNLLEVAHRGTVPSFGLRFPLGAEAWMPAFWLELMRRTLRGGTAPFCFFWTTPSAKGGVNRLDIYFTPPNPVAFLHLLDPELDSDTLYALDGTAAPDSGRVPESLRQAAAGWSVPGLGLRDALDAIGPPPQP